MSIQYTVECIVHSKVCMHFVQDTTPDNIRGKYTGYNSPYCMTGSVRALSDKWPSYYPVDKTLSLPGRMRKRDTQVVKVSVEHWPGVRKLLDDMGAVLVECCPVPIHLEEHFRMSAPYNTHPDADSDFQQMYQFEPYEHPRPENSPTYMGIGMSDADLHRAISQRSALKHGIPLGSFGDFLDTVHAVPYDKDGHREIDLTQDMKAMADGALAIPAEVLHNYSVADATMTLRVMKARDRVRGVSVDNIFLDEWNEINAENNNEGDSSNMIKMNKSAVVKELETVKVAFVKAIEAQAGDIDAKVTAAYADLKADAKKTSVVVEYIDPVSALPMVKQYDEVIAILALSAEDTITDTDINQSCACQIVQMRSLDRQMALANGNLSKKRITISRG